MSTWFTRCAELFAPQRRVLDLACGCGRHAIGAARLGADVTAVDIDVRKLNRAKQCAREAGVKVHWVRLDLTDEEPPSGPYDIVMMFNYLDRARMPYVRELVRPGGHLIIETFLKQQRQLGWGPTSDDHLLSTMELLTLVAPFEVLFGREVLEAVDGRARVVASVVAQRRSE